MPKKLNHSAVNSVGVIVGIALGATSLSLQLSPKSEALVIDGGEWIDRGVPLQFRSTALLPKGNHTLVGPLFWKVTVNNPTDRAVSLKSATALIEDGARGSYYSTGIFQGVFLDDLRTNAFPFTIPPYESKAVFVAGYLPGWFDLAAEGDCMTPKISVGDFQRCAFRKGFDLFGNKLTVMKAPDGSYVGAAWPIDAYQPALRVDFVSGGGKVFKSTMTIMPFAANQP